MDFICITSMNGKINISILLVKSMLFIFAFINLYSVFQVLLLKRVISSLLKRHRKNEGNL